ncbi:hypothetical protein TNCV_1243401 [Trichonephila clavipes]|nr:hypothetical protein TNCV_1243401 [Trichonephila clavipes]
MICYQTNELVRCVGGTGMTRSHTGIQGHKCHRCEFGAKKQRKKSRNGNTLMGIKTFYCKFVLQQVLIITTFRPIISRLREPQKRNDDAHLFPGVRGQVEDEDGEPGDAHAGDDEVDGVEERLPAQGDVEGRIRLGPSRLALCRCRESLSDASGPPEGRGIVGPKSCWYPGNERVDQKAKQGHKSFPLSIPQLAWLGMAADKACLICGHSRMDGDHLL